MRAIHVSEITKATAVQLHCALLYQYAAGCSMAPVELHNSLLGTS